MPRNPRLIVFICVLAVGSLACTSTAPGACSGDAACDGGRCVAGACRAKSCATRTCASHEVCIDDACTDALCVGRTCDPGTLCAKGNCLPTACAGSTCPSPQVCEPNLGRCVDLSCVGVVCPASQTCQAGLCVGGTVCGAVTCLSTEICVGGLCHVVCDTQLCAPGLTCAAGRCVAPDAGSGCGGATCAAGQTCDLGQCVETACLGVRCDGGVCRAGQCLAPCEVSCDDPCPSCVNGRGCDGGTQCQSRLCAAGTCTACTLPAQCPNGGLCQGGICRSGLLGPCTSTLDCNPGAPNLTCDNGKCRLPTGATCNADPECVSSIRCVNLVCARPRCQLQLLETQQLPQPSGVNFTGMASGLSTQGESYVTVAQWDQVNTPAQRDVRRYRVSPGGDAGVIEQVPTSPPLQAMPPDSVLAKGHFDSPGTAVHTAFLTLPAGFSWFPGGGAFDGRLAVRVTMTGFNNDLRIDSFDTRVAKCGDHFYFAVRSTTVGRALVRYSTPQPIGSGTTHQELTASSARRDNTVFPALLDLNCTSAALYVLGVQGGTVYLARLNPLTLADLGPPTVVPSSTWFVPNLQNPGHLNLAIVDDTYAYISGNNPGDTVQFWDGGAQLLGRVVSQIDGHFSINANAQGIVVHTVNPPRVRRYARRMQDGSTPPPDLDCIWQ